MIEQFIAEYGIKIIIAAFIMLAFVPYLLSKLMGTSTEPEIYCDRCGASWRMRARKGNRHECDICGKEWRG